MGTNGLMATSIASPTVNACAGLVAVTRCGERVEPVVLIFDSQLDLAWFAGIYEGEGNIYARKSGHAGIAIRISSTDRDIVARICAVMGFGTVDVRSVRETHLGTKPQYRWTLSRFEQVQAVVAVCWPWLGARRRAQALTMLQRSARAHAALHLPRQARLALYGG
jgi:hypothetical protein